MTTIEEKLRGQLVSMAQNIVVKVGTRVLTDGDRVADERIRHLVQQVNRLVDQGRRVSLVSSGAVGTAMHLLRRQRPQDLGELQAFAAIGQAELIHHYNREFVRFNRFAAQVLLTPEDMNHRRRYLNLRNTFFSLFELGAIPIINENDCVATDEIAATFGDNDRLAATVAMLVDADLLIILSDVACLFDRVPTDEDARPISFVPKIDAAVHGYSNDQGDMDHRASRLAETRSEDAGSAKQLSRGGMGSKIIAAEMATSAGIPTIIAGGRSDEILDRLLSGHQEGTLFPGDSRPVSSWKRWLKSSLDAAGAVQIDDGAARAVSQLGRSLLPIGAVAIDGEFRPGDLILVQGAGGQTIARGITNYSSDDARRILGRKSEAFSEILGRVSHEELIHRNNLVLV